MQTPFTTVDGGPTEESWVLYFESAAHDDWGTEEEELHLHAAYQAEGLPYTVTRYTYEPPLEDDLDWYSHPSLTASERNPSLR